MKPSLSSAAVTQVDVDLLIVPVPGQDFAKHPVFVQLDAALDGELARIAKLEDFTGKRGQVFSVHTFGKLAAKKLRIYALAGKEATAEECRLAAVSAARSARDVKSVAVLCASNDPEHLRALSEGVLLGNYRYDEFLTSSARKPKAAPRLLFLLGRKATAADKKA